MKLSLCIPTYNEEKNLHIALDSAYDIATEVVIIDGGSSDKTVEIAKSYGKKVVVYHVDNPPNFLINKQRAIEKAKEEWILQLDADEALTPELKKEIQVILSKSEESSKKHSDRDSSSHAPQDDDVVGYWIPRKNFFLGRFLLKGGVYPDSVLRLYKREKAHFILKDVHEHAQVDGQVGTTKHAMEHWADPTFERYLERWNRYTTFDALQAFEKKEKLCGKCHFIGKPFYTFLTIYFRHKGFQDGFPGFVWALFSSIRYWAIYIKWRQMISK
jgi:glycosyltransferase involved in cell wall biosynthesis